MDNPYHPGESDGTPRLNRRPVLRYYVLSVVFVLNAAIPFLLSLILINQELGLVSLPFGFFGIRMGSRNVSTEAVARVLLACSAFAFFVAFVLHRIANRNRQHNFKLIQQELMS